MTPREQKDHLYEQVARIGKALASPKRLELLELLAQAERSVEELALEAAIDIKLASAHLKALRQANLVQSRRDGKRMVYRVAGHDVSALAVHVRHVAQLHLLELNRALQALLGSADAFDLIDRQTLLQRAERGDVVVLDVRPSKEYQHGHLPHAISMPLDELADRLAQLPPAVEIVAYCRGPFCLMSDEAVTLLRAHGHTARKLSDGVREWQSAGLALHYGVASNS